MNQSAKTQAVIVRNGVVVAQVMTAAKNGEVVSYGFHKAIGGNLVETGKGKISRAQKYIGNDELMDLVEISQACAQEGRIYRARMALNPRKVIEKPKPTMLDQLLASS